MVDDVVGLMDYVDSQSKLSPEAGDASAATTTYNNVVTIKKKTAFNIVFEHSSLSYSLYKTSGQLLYTVVTCNHGSCASSSSMSTKCSKTFSQTTVDAYASDLLCDFYGSVYPAHVCNNDTRAEYLSIKNRKRGTWSSCTTPRLYAPACD